MPKSIEDLIRFIPEIERLTFHVALLAIFFRAILNFVADEWGRSPRDDGRSKGQLPSSATRPLKPATAGGRSSFYLLTAIAAATAGVAFLLGLLVVLAILDKIV